MAAPETGTLSLLSGALGGGAIGAFTSYLTTTRTLDAEHRRILENWKEDWGIRQHSVFEEFFKHWMQKEKSNKEDWEQKYRDHLVNFMSVFSSEEILSKALALANPRELHDGKAIEELLRLAHKELFPREYPGAHNPGGSPFGQGSRRE